MRTMNRKPAPVPLTDIILQTVRVLDTDRYRPPDLPAVYRVAWQRSPGLTLGIFHDAIRTLHAGGRVCLIPWTRALALIPDRCNAIFIDGEVMYFVSLPRLAAA